MIFTVASILTVESCPPAVSEPETAGKLGLSPPTEGARTGEEKWLGWLKTTSEASDGALAAEGGTLLAGKLAAVGGTSAGLSISVGV